MCCCCTKQCCFLLLIVTTAHIRSFSVCASKRNGHILIMLLHLVTYSLFMLGSKLCCWLDTTVLQTRTKQHCRLSVGSSCLSFYIFIPFIIQTKIRVVIMPGAVVRDRFVNERRRASNCCICNWTHSNNKQHSKQTNKQKKQDKVSKLLLLCVSERETCANL